MTRNDIIRMAHEANLCDANGEDDDSVNIAGQLERFAALVAAAEREACARLCDGIKGIAARLAAVAIRARGEA